MCTELVNPASLETASFSFSEAWSVGATTLSVVKDGLAQSWESLTVAPLPSFQPVIIRSTTRPGSLNERNAGEVCAG